MTVEVGRVPPRPPFSASPSAGVTDTGLICLLILARFYDLPADGSQLRHLYAQSGQLISDTELLRAAKHVGLKAGVVKTQWPKLAGTPFPAIVKHGMVGMSCWPRSTARRRSFRIRWKGVHSYSPV